MAIGDVRMEFNIWHYLIVRYIANDSVLFCFVCFGIDRTMNVIIVRARTIAGALLSTCKSTYPFHSYRDTGLVSCYYFHCIWFR